MSFEHISIFARRGMKRISQSGHEWEWRNFNSPSEHKGEGGITKMGRRGVRSKPEKPHMMPRGGKKGEEKRNRTGDTDTRSRIKKKMP